jgi:hypothetical protein
VKTKAQRAKKPDFLFPLENLWRVKISRGTLPPLFIYHRRDEAREQMTLLGRTGQILIRGLGMTAEHEVFGGWGGIRSGFFMVKKEAITELAQAYIPPTEEKMIRFVMAGVTLGERRMIYHIQENENPPKASISEGQVDRLAVTTIIWRLWEKWASPEFKAACVELPIHEAHSELNSILQAAGIPKITVEALKKALQRLKLPL